MNQVVYTLEEAAKLLRVPASDLLLAARADDDAPEKLHGYWIDDDQICVSAVELARWWKAQGGGELFPPETDAEYIRRIAMPAHSHTWRTGIVSGNCIICGTCGKVELAPDAIVKES